MSLTSTLVLGTFLSVLAGTVYAFGSSAIASGLGADPSDVWQAMSRFIGLVAAGVVLLACFPPPWARSRSGVASLGDGVG